MPEYLFWSRMEMMDRLEAERALALIGQQRAATSVRMQEDSRAQYEAGLRRTTAASGRAPRATAGQQAAMGIEVVREPGVHPGWAALEQKDDEEVMPE